MTLSRAQRDALLGITTATLTSVLLKKGLRNVWIRGAAPLAAEQGRRVGEAFTLRFLPAREDLASPAHWASPVSTRGAIEAMPEDVIVVADALGMTDAGIMGDVLAARMVRRKVAGLVTDGAMRDIAGVRATGLPVWCAGVAAPPSFSSLTFVNWQEPVSCGGVAVFPGDIIVADHDGAVVIPPALLEATVTEALEQEQIEAWVLAEVERGVPLPGLYPMSPETRARYEARPRSPHV
jgi:regulator of RNase E activity RraA